MKYDLELFQALNAEYASKLLVPAPPSYAAADLAERGKKRAAGLMKRFQLSGCRVLEIGCGRGETISAFAVHHGCEGVGVDITERPEWASAASTVTLLKRDITYDAEELGTFDLIYSIAVWEHLRHPFAMLKQVANLLRPGGKAHISANLYRGPRASHRYHEVYFPWPHLLFADEIFEQFYVSLGRRPSRPSWVNRLSIADYRTYFGLAGLIVERESFSVTPIDEALYARFGDVLERFPRYDLERDFIHVDLSR